MPRPSVADERRAQILQAAWEAILERGFAGTRIADIAKRSGTSTGTVIYYFPTKDEVLLETLRFNGDRSYERYERELRDLDDPREKILRITELQLPDGDVADEWHLWLELYNEAARRPELRERFNSLYQRWRAFVHEIVAQGVATGDFVAVDVDEFVDHLTAVVDGSGIGVIAGSPHVDRDRMRRICERYIRSELFGEET